MKPTPGPWIWHRSENPRFPGWQLQGDVNNESGAYEVVCNVEDIPKADQNLIGASPELFACVAAFVGEFGFDVECDEAISGADAVDWISQNMRDFRNALNKARGLR